MPQIGSGRGSGPGGFEDYGREQVTQMQEDFLKFRTPSLRNIALTAPYGHSGAYNENRQAVLPTHPELDAENYQAMDDPEIVDYIANHNELAPFSYSDKLSIT